MDELKTLKDIKETQIYGQMDQYDREIVEVEKLRHEAINDIKKLYEIKNYTDEEAQKSPNYMSCCTNYPLCSMGGGFLVCGEDKKQIEPIIRYIMWKFNITKEELK